jgi:hypothetical protein
MHLEKLNKITLSSFLAIIGRSGEHAQCGYDHGEYGHADVWHCTKWQEVDRAVGCVRVAWVRARPTAGTSAT